MLPASSIEQYAMVFRHGRGHSHDRNRVFGRGYGTFGGDRDSYDGRQTIGDKRSRQCKYYGRNNYISEKYWEKFGRPEWAQLADADSLALSDLLVFMLLQILTLFLLALSLLFYT